MRTPCQGGGGAFEPKQSIAFTDSLYNDFPDTLDVIISGDSPLYFKARSHYWSYSDSISATLYIKDVLESTHTVYLYNSGDSCFYGSFENSKELGLKSFGMAHIDIDSVRLELDPFAVTFDEVGVCLPKLITSTDTVIINHSDMKVSADFIAGLEIIHDVTGDRVEPAEIVDSVGYRYKSKWVSNTSYSKTTKHKIFYRSFPDDTTKSLWWDGNRDSCSVTFCRDSLYAVGGSLSVACEGYLTPVENINNCFNIDTDSTINDTTTIPTRLILIDSDPSNQMFLDSLQYDIIKAIAWQEYAGSNDGTHCTPYHNRYNNYWDSRITESDTCLDTRFPCENRLSTATGIMQMLRSTWENLFNLSGVYTEPDSFYACKWDSLAWSWKINIFNGKYIHQKSCFYHMTSAQKAWDSLYTPASDYTPDSTNREDLATYGYKEGSTFMRKIRTLKDWNTKIKSFFYVNNVRMYKDEKPWED